MNETAAIQIACLAPRHTEAAARCQAALQRHDMAAADTGGASYRLVFAEEGVALYSLLDVRQAPIKVDFYSGKLAHRRQFGGGRGQLIAKAAGLGPGIYPHVFDATAGLGGDAFVLASLGCRVTMAERSPVACALLRDGLERARQVAATEDESLTAILDRMTLWAADSLELMLQSTEPLADVVYLDPMFPERHKSAAVKKEMQAFHAIIGGDEDADRLLEPALKCAEYRVVVKRPRIARSLSGRSPGYQLTGKSSRFDVYPIKRMGS